MKDTNNKILWAVLVLNLLATGGLGYHVLGNKGVNEEAMNQYISTHAQVILDSVNAHLQGTQAQTEEQAAAKIKDYKDFLYNDDRHPSLGSKDATFTVVEFLDYNCGYCKKAYETIAEILKSDKNVRFVLIEIPILHESSALAAKWALAAHDQKGYVEFHKQLMENKGPITEERLAEFAKKAGLDVAKIKEVAASDAIAALIDENLKVATEIGISGTPGFLVGDEIVRGYLPYEAMKATIEKHRAGKN